MNSSFDSLLVKLYDDVKDCDDVRDCIYGNIINYYRDYTSESFLKHQFQNPLFYSLFGGKTGHFARNDSFVYDYDADIKHSKYKIYMSVIPEKRIDIFMKIMDKVSAYQDKNNCSLGQTKFRIIPSEDEIVLRFCNDSQLAYFMNVFLQDEEIMSSLKPANMFFPSVNNIGLVTDNGGSYLKFVTDFIASYFRFCEDTNNVISSHGFYNFVLNYNFSEGKDIHVKLEDREMFQQLLLAKIMGINDFIILENVLGIDLPSILSSSDERHYTVKSGDVHTLSRKRYKISGYRK